MTRTTIAVLFAILASSGLVAPAHAQLGSLGKALSKADDMRQELTFTDEEEDELGKDISARLREKYGVVQDRAVHTYVTLVGSVLASATNRPTLKWTFIVLDTDGVNAFAAPGGYVHITRGALALLQNESELADVLAHEISHVTLKHTLRAIQKSKLVGLGAQATRRDVLEKATDQGYSILLENGFDRKDEMEADKAGVTLANRVGYSPAGLGEFLTRLADRNKDLKDPSGLFASHPETVARLEGLKQVIAANKLSAAALVTARFHQNISYKPVAVAAVAQLGGPGASPSTQPSGSGRLGLAGLNAVGRDKSSGQTISSAGSRGVNPDRDAKGGPNKTLVAVSVTSAEVAEFRRGISG
jgi:predicted Zn-dependent protease